MTAAIEANDGADQATLTLKDGRQIACLLPGAPAARSDFLARLQSGSKSALAVITPEGDVVHVPPADVAGVEVAPPYCLVRDFLSPVERAQVLEYTLAHESEFAEAAVASQDTQWKWAPDTKLRRSRILSNLGPLISLVVPKVGKLIPALLDDLRLAPTTFDRVECQVTAHGEGDFFDTHTDNGVPEIAHRRVSYVYYFHQEPKRFTGGQLRLYRTHIEHGAVRCGGAAAEIDPPGNGLMIFPSALYHQVMPIRCPSAALADQRLTFNGWLI